MKLRPPALASHRWFGLLAGLLLVVIGISGSLLIFSQELDQTLYPQLLQVQPQAEMRSHQSLVEIAKTAQPNLKLHRITVPRSPEATYTVMMVDANGDYTDIYLNPYTGTVLGSRPWKQTLAGFLVELHVHLFAGDWGMQLVGISGGVLLLIGFTGLLLWNGWRNLKHGFTIRWQAPWPLIHYDVHKAIGALSVALLALIAVTGMAMVFWEPFEQGVYRLTGAAKPPELASTMVPGKAPMPIDALLQRATAAFPEAQLFKFFPAKQPEATFNVWLELPQEHEFNKNPYLYLDQYSGEILRISGSKQDSLADRLLNAPYILHVGNYGGLVTRLIYFIVGLAPLILLLTGWVRWQQRRWLLAHRREAIQQSQRMIVKP